ncbi:very short patch repair endonuclease [Bradyrhizobium sp. Ghvi]|uniref:very short patch repair endonuclease n=1 Tax=Bradyrhizobium sp. Ghvi TaxID=1855319 RepID=UPI0024BF57C0|nr:very short patch repair endonuclease [Bradyrhizobium sp. Ghvi]
MITEASGRALDKLTPEKRSQNMARIRGRNTGPELAVRKVLHALGVGYRLHVRGLPGRPDIVMQGRRKIIEVRGCFWHRHSGCQFAYMPKSNHLFWQAKFQGNVDRDERNLSALQNSGWDVLVVWECETNKVNVLKRRLESFVRGKGHRGEKTSRKEHSQKARATCAGTQTASAGSLRGLRRNLARV